MNTDFLGAPLVLLGAIWVTFAPVLTANKTLHEQRDVVFGICDLAHLSPQRAYDVRRAAFLHSYIPLLLGILVFLTMMTGMIAYAASTITLPPGHDHDRRLCYAAAVMPAVIFMGFAFGGGLDIFVMRRLLRDDKKRLMQAATESTKAAPCYP